MCFNDLFLDLCVLGFKQNWNKIFTFKTQLKKTWFLPKIPFCRMQSFVLMVYSWNCMFWTWMSCNETECWILTNWKWIFTFKTPFRKTTFLNKIPTFRMKPSNMCFKDLFLEFCTLGLYVVQKWEIESEFSHSKLHSENTDFSKTNKTEFQSAG